MGFFLRERFTDLNKLCYNTDLLIYTHIFSSFIFYIQNYYMVTSLIIFITNKIKQKNYGKSLKI